MPIMRIALIERPSNMVFNVATPEQQPLGGMASSICYLARALAARGHDVTLVANLPDGTPPLLMGVQHLPLQPVLVDAAGFFRKGDYDAAIALNYPDIAPYIKNGNPRKYSPGTAVTPRRCTGIFRSSSTGTSIQPKSNP